MEINKVTLKRINGDFKRFNDEKPKYFDVYLNPNNPLEIYFLIYGRENTDYEGGIYIGKIVHSPNYPIKAPDYYMFTPNGRFEINKKICLTNSGYHQSDWAPAAWNLVTLLEGLSSVWHSDIKEDKIGISHMNSNSDLIKSYASNSNTYNLKNLSDIYLRFPKIKDIYKN
jgi:ubiquitin-protein ligase